MTALERAKRALVDAIDKTNPPSSEVERLTRVVLAAARARKRALTRRPGHRDEDGNRIWPRKPGRPGDEI